MPQAADSEGGNNINNMETTLESKSKGLLHGKFSRLEHRVLIFMEHHETKKNKLPQDRGNLFKKGPGF